MDLELELDLSVDVDTEITSPTPVFFERRTITRDTSLVSAREHTPALLASSSTSIANVATSSSISSQSVQVDTPTTGGRSRKRPRGFSPGADAQVEVKTAQSTPTVRKKEYGIRSQSVQPPSVAASQKSSAGLFAEPELPKRQRVKAVRRWSPTPSTQSPKTKPKTTINKYICKIDFEQLLEILKTSFAFQQDYELTKEFLEKIKPSKEVIAKRRLSIPLERLFTVEPVKSPKVETKKKTEVVRTNNEQEAESLTSATASSSDDDEEPERPITRMADMGASPLIPVPASQKRPPTKSKGKRSGIAIGSIKLKSRPRSRTSDAKDSMDDKRGSSPVISTPTRDYDDELNDSATEGRPKRKSAGKSRDFIQSVMGYSKKAEEDETAQIENLKVDKVLPETETNACEKSETDFTPTAVRMRFRRATSDFVPNKPDITAKASTKSSRKDSTPVVKTRSESKTREVRPPTEDKTKSPRVTNTPTIGSVESIRRSGRSVTMTSKMVEMVGSSKPLATPPQLPSVDPNSALGIMQRSIAKMSRRRSPTPDTFLVQNAIQRSEKEGIKKTWSFSHRKKLAAETSDDDAEEGMPSEESEKTDNTDVDENTADDVTAEEGTLFIAEEEGDEGPPILEKIVFPHEAVPSQASSQRRIEKLEKGKNKNTKTKEKKLTIPKANVFRGPAAKRPRIAGKFQSRNKEKENESTVQTNESLQESGSEDNDVGLSETPKKIQEKSDETVKAISPVVAPNTDIITTDVTTTEGRSARRQTKRSVKLSDYVLPTHMNRSLEHREEAKPFDESTASVDTVFASPKMDIVSPRNKIQTTPKTNDPETPKTKGSGTPKTKGSGTPKTKVLATPKTKGAATPNAEDQAASETDDETTHKTDNQAASETDDETTHNTDDQATPKTEDQATNKTEDQATPKTKDLRTPKTSDTPGTQAVTPKEIPASCALISPVVNKKAVPPLMMSTRRQAHLERERKPKKSIKMRIFLGGETPMVVAHTGVSSSSEAESLLNTTAESDVDAAPSPADVADAEPEVVAEEVSEVPPASPEAPAVPSPKKRRSGQSSAGFLPGYTPSTKPVLGIITHLCGLEENLDTEINGLMDEIMNDICLDDTKHKERLMRKIKRRKVLENKLAARERYHRKKKEYDEWCVEREKEGLPVVTFTHSPMFKASNSQPELQPTPSLGIALENRERANKGRLYKQNEFLAKSIKKAKSRLYGRSEPAKITTAKNAEMSREASEGKSSEPVEAPDVSKGRKGLNKKAQQALDFFANSFQKDLDEAAAESGNERVYSRKTSKVEISAEERERLAKEAEEKRLKQEKLEAERRAKAPIPLSAFMHTRQPSANALVKLEPEAPPPPPQTDFFYREIVNSNASTSFAIDDNEDVDVMDEAGEPIPADPMMIEPAVADVAADSVAEAIDRLMPRPLSLDGTYSISDCYAKVREESEMRRAMFDRIVDIVSEYFVAAQSAADSPSALYNLTMKHSSIVRDVYGTFSQDRVDVVNWAHAVLVEMLPVHFLSAYLQLLRYAKAMAMAFILRLVKTTKQNHGSWPEVTQMIVEWVGRRPQDPDLTQLQRTVHAQSLSDVVFLLASPAMTVGDFRQTNKLSDTIYNWLCDMGDKSSQVIRFEIDEADSSTNLAQVVDDFVHLIVEKVKETLRKHMHKRVVLVGWQTTCYVNHRAAQMVHGISAIIDLAFPVMTRYGPRGSADDDMNLTYCPSLFICGAQAEDFCPTAMAELRAHSIARTGLVVVGRADCNLNVTTLALCQLGITQRVVYRTILQHICDFLALEDTRQERSQLIPVEINSVYNIENCATQFSNGGSTVAQSNLPPSKVRDSEEKKAPRKRKTDSGRSSNVVSPNRPGPPPLSLPYGIPPTNKQIAREKFTSALNRTNEAKRARVDERRASLTMSDRPSSAASSAGTTSMPPTSAPPTMKTLTESGPLDPASISLG